MSNNYGTEKLLRVVAAAECSSACMSSLLCWLFSNCHKAVFGTQYELGSR